MIYKDVIIYIDDFLDEKLNKESIPAEPVPVYYDFNVTNQIGVANISLVNGELMATIQMNVFIKPRLLNGFYPSIRAVVNKQKELYFDCLALSDAENQDKRIKPLGFYND